MTVLRRPLRDRFEDMCLDAGGGSVCEHGRVGSVESRLGELQPFPPLHAANAPHAGHRSVAAGRPSPASCERRHDAASFLRPNLSWLLRTQSDHRLWETVVLFHLRDAFRAATSGWRGRTATGTSRRRCCRLPASLMATPACRSRPVRTTGSPSAGSPSPRGACTGWPLAARAGVNRLAAASKTACSASRERKPACRTGTRT